MDAPHDEPQDGRCLGPTSAGFSWLTLHHRYPSCGTYVHHADTRNCVALILHAEGRLRSIVDGRETRHEVTEGMVGFVPADRARHTALVSTDRSTSAFLVLIPVDALHSFADTAEISLDLPERIAFRDPVVHSLLRRLRHVSTPEAASCGMHGADLVRELILEMAGRLTGHRPACRTDTQPFPRDTLSRIVKMIDHNLAAPPTLDAVAATVGLSASHCARKFRLSTGMSLCRFQNLRRVHAALDRLRRTDTDLARMALDLGFSSQSHFTRVCSGCIGMTPARYRRGFRGRSVAR